MAALAMLEPHAPETIDVAVQLLADTDVRVSTGAIRALQEVARARPASAAGVQRALAWTLRVGGSGARHNAARVVGALGSDAAFLVSALVDAGTDSADATRAAVATALGAVLEAAPLTSTPTVRDRATALLFQMVRDPAWPVRDAALEALFRDASIGHRLAEAIAVARMDPRPEIRERAAAMAADRVRLVIPR
jgi:HEAT repeat protein